MKIHRTVENDGKRVVITPGDRFDFGSHREFTASYEDVDPSAEVVVDMRFVHYLDSSALGMLLMLREHLGDDQANVRIVHAGGGIRKILEIANFQQLFPIE